MSEEKNKSYFFKAKNTYLRGIVDNDYSRISSWINDPNFNKFLVQGWKPMNSSLVKEQFEMEQHVESAIQFAQCLISTDELVGWCGLYRWDKIAHSAEIRSFVGTEYWNKGYGTEQYAMLLNVGFERYNFNRISFGTHEENKGTLMIYKKLGCTKEGVIRQGQYRNGKYSDDYMFSVLRNEYNESIKSLCSQYLNQ